MREKVLKLLNSYRETHFTNIECDTCICNDEDFIGLVNYVENMTPWHSVADGDLPPVNTDCLFVYGTIIDKGYMREDKTISIDAKFAPLLDIEDITYWMEIPKLPEKEEKHE